MPARYPDGLGAALALGAGADALLGTQGDPWDTQSDMFMALIGALLATTILPRLHDSRIAAVSRKVADG